jgi:hypothetical protein
MHSETFQMFQLSFKKALQWGQANSDPKILLKYCKRLSKMKNYKQLLQNIMDKELLGMDERAAKVCRNYTIKNSKSCQKFYSMQETLQISDKQLYDLSIQYLTSKDFSFDLQTELYYKFYRFLDLHLTKKDYEKVMKFHAEKVKNMSYADESLYLTFVGCIAFQK